jgi:hypothetical protein
MIEPVKIKLHSMTDLITNSSTVIYTYSEASKEACEKMIDAIFETFGIDKKCSDVFTLSIATENIDEYICESDPDDDTPDDMLDDDGDCFDSDKVSKLLEDIESGAVEQPEWLTNKIESISDSRDYPLETTLIITPKDEKYNKMAELVSSFLYSTDHEAGRDG